MFPNRDRVLGCKKYFNLDEFIKPKKINYTQDLNLCGRLFFFCLITGRFPEF